MSKLHLDNRVNEVYYYCEIYGLYISMINVSLDVKILNKEQSGIISFLNVDIWL